VLLELEEVGILCNTGSYVSIVIQGVESLDIYDSNGNRLMQQAQWLYRQARGGNLERVGEVIPINMDTLRFQYVLDTDGYVFRNVNFSDVIQPEILVMSFDNWLATSQTLYSSFEVSNHMELQVSLAIPRLFDAVTNAHVEPNKAASAEDVRQWNGIITNNSNE